MTTPHFFVEEHQILTALFEEGLELLHLRKPGTEPVYSERLLSLIPEAYRDRIVVHDHFYLKSEYGLRGIHLNSRNPEVPKGYKGQVSLSCHALEEVERLKKQVDYVTLSPIFNSISKLDYNSAFSPATLREAGRRKLIDRRVAAMGGVDLDNIASLADYGFGAAVVLGAVWSRFDMHHTSDFKELINHFRKLRRAVG